MTEEEELNSRLPIIPHTTVTETDCPGCLVVGLKDGQCDILCNECASLIGSAPVIKVERFFQSLYGMSKGKVLRSRGNQDGGNSSKG